MLLLDRSENTRRSVADDDLSPARLRDVLGRLKTSRHQNIYEADFEYGTQPLRWEALTVNGGAVTHVATQGGVQMSVPTTSGAIAMRQSRPYHRYQPGKTMFLASAVMMGTAFTNNRQRIGFFDDGNGVFFEQADPDAANGNSAGMFVVVRSDLGGVPNDLRVPLFQWNGAQAVIKSLDWSRIQMLYMEFAWYGAGCVRFGVFVDGQPHVLHQIGFGNRAGQVAAWSRTGNLPVRYETRNIGTASGANTMTHWGVSVVVEGGVDDQRGFTYNYGRQPSATLAASIGATGVRVPILSIRGRVMGNQQAGETAQTATGGSTTSLARTGAGWTTNQWRGLYVFAISGAGVGQLARITANDATTLTVADTVTGGALSVAFGSGTVYTIGLPNRGQLLPRRLNVSLTGPCRIEIISNGTLTSPTWQALAAQGSPNSFAERDVAASAITGGEVVYGMSVLAATTLPELQVDQLFPLVNNIRGNLPDILTVCITANGTNALTASAELNCQEAMS